MKTLLLATFITFTFLSYGQTKRIYHKSHSGSRTTFTSSKIAHGNTKSNFGIPGNKPIIIIDTIKAISTTEIQLIYRQSNKCHSPFAKISDLKPSDFERKTKNISNVEGLNKNSTREDILRIGLTSASKIWFDNPLEDAVFIGFKKK